MSKHDTVRINAKTHAQRLFQRYNGYYPAAKKLGNPSLRATLWRFLNEEGFKPSKHFMAALWEWADVDPVIIQAQPGTPVFGDVGLIELAQGVDILILSLGEIDESLLIKCQACGRQTIKRSGTQRFCRRHSWATKEGRRWHRQQRKEVER